MPTKNTHFVVTVKFFVMIDPPQFRFDSRILSFGAVINKPKEISWNIRLVMFLYVGRVGLYIGPGRVVTGGQR